MTGMELTGLEWTVMTCSAAYTLSKLLNWKHQNKVFLVWLVVFTFLLLRNCMPR